jgi:hypothetical protein
VLSNLTVLGTSSLLPGNLNLLYEKALTIMYFPTIEKKDNKIEREEITELDNKATLQTSIKWDSTNRDKRERERER